MCSCLAGAIPLQQSYGVIGASLVRQVKKSHIRVNNNMSAQLQVSMLALQLIQAVRKPG